MNRTGGALILFAAVLSLQACGGHGSSPIPSSPNGQLVPVSFTIVIPPAITPQYISPSTLSATISVNSGTPAVANCTGGSCTTTVLAPIGSDTFAVSLYDAANGTGNVLSQGSATQTIVSGVANSVSVTFNGVPKTVTITTSGSAFTSVPVPSATTIPLTVTAKDAGGNTIIGTYSSPVQLTIADGTRGLSVNGTHVTINNTTVTNVPSSSTVVTATYNGNTQFGADRISAWDTYPTGTPQSSVLIKGPCTLPNGTGRFGYYPCDLQSAYGLTSTSSSGGGSQTVAIVDAHDDPNAESDLAVYRSAFGLPACTTANGCFKKRAQDGSQNFPTVDNGWAGEIALDLDMVSAICPNCHILLVEAKTSNNNDLYLSENEAVALGATEISNSWDGSEYASESTDETLYFKHPGIPITVSSGDDGFQGGVQFPASSQYVTAVGGTTLTAQAGGRNWAETAWSCTSAANCDHTTAHGGSGSGCSAYIAKPPWQTPFIPTSDCANRMVADVSADASGDTPVWVYITVGDRGWSLFGGTSASAPMIAGVYAISGNAASVQYASSLAYANTSSLWDITSGSTGTCSPTYFCNARASYDGPTGLGTPNGAVGAFIKPQSVENSAPILTDLNYHPGPSKRLCAPPPPGYASCQAIVRTDKN
jgi:hypothetical protein